MLAHKENNCTDSSLPGRVNRVVNVPYPYPITTRVDLSSKRYAFSNDTTIMDSRSSNLTGRVEYFIQ